MACSLDCIKQHILDYLGQYIDISYLKADALVFPPRIELGDFSYPCFELSKKLRQAPHQIAHDIAEQAQSNDVVARVTADGPYVNFFIQPQFLQNVILHETSVCNPLASLQKKVMIEYSGPNPCKTFHIGHFRNTILGSALINLYGYNGYEVIPVNYLNDTGTHVAKVIWLYLRSYKGKEPHTEQGAWLGDLYVEANSLLEEDESLMQEVYEIHRGLESGDKKYQELLETFKQWSKEGFDRIYAQLDAEFAIDFYDHQYIHAGKEIIQDLLLKGIAQKSQGAVIVDLEEYDLHTALILKSDGSALYITKDLAMAKDRFETYGVDRLVYVVGAEQILHFKQIFKILELYGFERAKDCFHLAYELVNTASGKKMSTREGTVVFYDDLYADVYKIMKKETAKRHEDWQDEQIKTTAEVLSLAALKFDMLKQDAQKRINFDISKAIDISGDTGPYIIYTMARVRSILEKGHYITTELENTYDLNTEEERLLLQSVMQMHELFVLSFENHKPSMIAHHLLGLAHQTNNFYHKYPILQDDNIERAATRLVLLKKVLEAFEEGLRILNIRWVDEM